MLHAWLTIIYDWIYENRVKTLHQNSHMHFDFTMPKGLEITLSNGKKRKKEK